MTTHTAKKRLAVGIRRGKRRHPGHRAPHVSARAARLGESRGHQQGRGPHTGARDHHHGIHALGVCGPRVRAGRCRREPGQRHLCHPGHGHRALQHEDGCRSGLRVFGQPPAQGRGPSPSRSAASSSWWRARHRCTGFICRNLLTLAEAGVVVMPPMLTYYTHPRS